MSEWQKIEKEDMDIEKDELQIYVTWNDDGSQWIHIDMKDIIDIAYEYIKMDKNEI